VTHIAVCECAACVRRMNDVLDAALAAAAVCDLCRRRWLAPPSATERSLLTSHVRCTRSAHVYDA